MQAAEIRAIIAEVLAAQQGANHPEVGTVVQEAISATLLSFGIEPGDRKELQADFRHLRKWRKSIESAEGLTFKIVVTTIVSGLAGAVWMGFKIAVGKS